MKDFKNSFYIISSKKERKPKANLGQSSYTQPQPFSQQYQQPGIQQNYEERKQTQKSTHALTPMSKEKPRKQTRSVLHQEVSEFNPSGQMSIKQLIKLYQTFRKRSKSQGRTMRSQYNNLTQQKEQSQDSYPRKESQAPFETYHKVRIVNPKINLRNRLNWITDSEKQKRSCKILRKSKAKLELFKWKSKPKKSKSNKENPLKSKRNISAVEAFDIYIGSVGNFNRNKQKYWIKEQQKKKEEEARMKRTYCDPDGSICKIKKEPNQVKERKTWRSPNFQSRQNWTTQTFIFNSREHELLS